MCCFKIDREKRIKNLKKKKDYIFYYINFQQIIACDFSLKNVQNGLATHNEHTIVQIYLLKCLFVTPDNCFLDNQNNSAAQN